MKRIPSFYIFIAVLFIGGCAGTEDTAQPVIPVTPSAFEIVPVDGHEHIYYVYLNRHIDTVMVHNIWWNADIIILKFPCIIDGRPRAVVGQGYVCAWVDNECAEIITLE